MLANDVMEKVGNAVARAAYDDGCCACIRWDSVVERAIEEAEEGLPTLPVTRKVTHLMVGDLIELGFIAQGCRTPDVEEVCIGQDVQAALDAAGLDITITVRGPSDCDGGSITGLVRALDPTP